MTPFAIAATALALAPDAFAASLARGIADKSASWMPALRIGFIFGLAEGGMAALGWLLAAMFAEPVRAFDHWIALIILSFLGVRMIREGVSSGALPVNEQEARPRSLFVAIATAIGTSIDAAAVGVALAFASANILILAPVIGLTSGGFAMLAYRFGPALGRRLGNRAEIAGGALLIAIGCWIFYSHMSDQ